MVDVTNHRSSSPSDICCVDGMEDRDDEIENDDLESDIDDDEEEEGAGKTASKLDGK